MNDKFIVAATVTGNATIDGLGGNDTVVFKAGQTFTATTNEVTLKNIENVVVDGGAAATTAQFNSNTKINKITLNDVAAPVTATALTVTAQVAAAAVAGSADVLNVANNSVANASLIVNGYETVNVELGAKTTTMVLLQADQAKGDTLSVNLKGGAAAGFTLTGLDTQTSTALQNIVIDGSELAGKIVVTGLATQAAGVTNITIKGSNADSNAFTTATTGLTLANNLKLVAGAKGDTFATTLAIDTFVAGAGNDTFTFAADVTGVTTNATQLVRLDTTGKKIAGVDTIENFGAGDKITVTGIKPLTSGSVKTTEADFYDFINAGTALVADNVGKVVEYDGDTYVYLDATAASGVVDLATVELVKLAGVTIDSLKLTGTVLELA